MSNKLKILCVGPQFRGSNAGGLFRALSRGGHLISIVDENYYFNFSHKKFITRVIDKVSRHLNKIEFNSKILVEAQKFTPDVVLVYKGAFVFPETITQLKELGMCCVNFYPDVSFYAHGSLLPKTLPLYHHVFTTKTFGLRDMKEKLGIVNSTFIPHGFDPELHRPLPVEQYNTELFDCDVSFIGGYSPKKASILTGIRKRLPDIKIKIWGEGWHNANQPEIQNDIQGKSIVGDLYVMGILSSKINLGILNESVQGASSGDLITSRTFHIPAAGGFMIHERTVESVTYFEEGKEAAFFNDANDLSDSIDYYLKHDKEREEIRSNGYKRCVRDYSLDQRAKLLEGYLYDKLKSK